MSPVLSEITYRLLLCDNFGKCPTWWVVFRYYSTTFLISCKLSRVWVHICPRRIGSRFVSTQGAELLIGLLKRLIKTLLDLLNLLCGWRFVKCTCTESVAHCVTSCSLVDRLLGRDRIPSASSVSVEEFQRFFDERVAKVRANTQGETPASFTSVQQGVSLATFEPITTNDVILAVQRLPDKSSAADPLPTRIFKEVVDVIAPYISELFNRSLSAGHYPAAFKMAFVTPVVKKPGLDAADPSSYRPISNLPVISKLLERLVVRQLVGYLELHSLLPQLQSGFRRNHSTETAVLKVLSDILSAVDCGDVAALALLDLSAAFDTVDHEILLERLRCSYGISGRAHDWFESYLHDRAQSGPSRNCSLHHLQSHLRRSTGVGTWSSSVHPVRRWCHRPYPGARSTAASLRRRHADLRMVPAIWHRRSPAVILGVFRRRFQLDAVEQATAQRE